MSTLLQQVVERAQGLSDQEKERLGALFLAEVEQALADEAFDALLDSTPDVLDALAAEARAEIAAGLTLPLDLERDFA
jgi:hypothetical protein